MKFNGTVERPEPIYYLTIELCESELDELAEILNRYETTRYLPPTVIELLNSLKKIKNAKA